MTKTPEVTETPKVTEEPVIIPTQNPNGTVIVTPVPDESEGNKEPIIIPTQNPNGTVIATPTPVVIETPDIPNEPATKIPEVTKVPEEEQPGTVATVTPTAVVITGNNNIPANPVVTPTPAPVLPQGNLDSIPTVTNVPANNSVVVAEPTEIPNDPIKKETNKKDPEDETKKNSIIVEDEVPSELPQTGALGAFLEEKTGTKAILISLPIGMLLALVGILSRKKIKK